MNRLWWLSGAIATGIIALLTITPVAATIVASEAGNWLDVLNNSYVRRVIYFSFYQATLSTVLSVGLAIPIALALSHKPFFLGRNLLLQFFSLSFILPTIVAIFGIVAVFGANGWLNTAIRHLGIQYDSIYGLPGILLAHVFFNMPLATRIFLINLENLPFEHWRLANQLGMKPIAIFRIIEWPALKHQLIPVATLIFTLCFTSFAIVMTLGGGPRATTIEVAIYQALRFDFDLTFAAILAVIQILICLMLMLISVLSPKTDATDYFAAPFKNSKQFNYQITQIAMLWQGPSTQCIHYIVILCAFMFCGLPLVAILISAFNAELWPVLLDQRTQIALVNTMIVALSSAFLSLFLALALLTTTRHLRVRFGYERAGRWLQLSGNAILVIPPLVLGTGLFILLRHYADVFSIALFLVVLINSLLTLPFVLRILDRPVIISAQKHDKLLQSLGLSGWNRCKWIDWPQLRKPIALSVALSATLSAGDFSAIALFGSERVQTLPLLLYQRMGSYRLDEAAVTAGLLLISCAILFIVINRLIGGRSYVKP